MLGDGEGDRGFADAAWPDDRQQALARKSRDERGHCLLAANHPRYREWEIMERRRSGGCGRRSPRRLLTAYGGDEIVATSRNGDDVAIAILAVAEGTAQSADLNLQIRFFDEGLRPSPGYQLLLADDLAGPLDHSSQNVKGAAAEPHGLVAIKQESLPCKQPERAKRDRVSAHWKVASFTPFYRILLDGG